MQAILLESDTMKGENNIKQVCGTCRIIIAIAYLRSRKTANTVGGHLLNTHMAVASSSCQSIYDQNLFMQIKRW